MFAIFSLSRSKSVVPGILTLAILLALFHCPANAQVLFGSMVGNVTDASDAAVPGASVKITDQATNEVRTFSANQNGAYNAVNLPAGTQTFQFDVQRTTAGQGATAQLVVTDACGDWPTFVGLGTAVP